MQITIRDEDLKVFADGLELLIVQLEAAKEHSTECPSIESVDMLTDVLADYDEQIAVFRRIHLELGSASV